MTAAKEGPTVARRASAGVHLAVVGVSFVLSFLIFQGVGLMPGEAIECMALGLLVTHLAAAITGVFVRRVTVWSCLILFAFAFFPAGWEGVNRVRKAAHLHYQAPYDRFRDHLASPVPESVSGLHFVPLEDAIHPDLMFRFDIAPADLDAIIQRLNLKRGTADQLLNPQDFFHFPYYLPLGDDFHLFQGTGRYEEVLTIKTNDSHTRAVFRMESSSYYRDRMWENGSEVQKRMDRDALDRAWRKNETQN